MFNGFLLDAQAAKSTKSNITFLGVQEFKEENSKEKQ